VPKPERALPDPRRTATAVLATGGLALYGINFPGSMEFDSFVQLVEARAESYSNWHPPVMSWLLGVFDALPGTAAAWFTAMDMLIVFAALIAVLWLPKKVSWAAVAVVGAMLFLPQLVLAQAVVWKDVLFANTVVAGFAVLAYAAHFWTRARLRNGLIALAAVLFALAVLTRQNGIVVVPVAVAALMIVAARHDGWRAAVVKGAGLLGVTVLLATGANALLQLRADDYPGREEQIKRLQIYDIAGILHREPEAPLMVLSRQAPELGTLLRAESKRLWSPVKNDTLETDEFVALLEAAPAPVVTAQWKATVAAYPGEYLATRALLLRWVVQSPEPGLCHPFHVGDEGDPADLKELGVKPRLNARDEKLADYGTFFLRHTPVYGHALFGLIGIGLMVLLLRRREPADVMLAALIVSAFVFTATFAVLSLACDWRYLYIVDLSVMTALVYAAADWRALLRQK
jgi:hypothetical protein